MTPEKLYELFRLEVDDIATPYLWSDEEFYAYLNEAQDLHITEIGGIADRSSQFTKITYKAGNKFLNFDPRILRIKGAWNGNNKRIDVVNLDNLEGVAMVDDYGSRSLTGLDDSLTGPVCAIITDVEEDKMQLYPIPETDGFIKLYVFRRALHEIVFDSEEFEVAPQYHLNLLNWVKYKAYGKQDVETFDGKKAAEFRTEFTAGVDKAGRDRAARHDRKRVVSYGGIPMS
jgi:hypothetical protein